MKELEEGDYVIPTPEHIENMKATDDKFHFTMGQITDVYHDRPHGYYYRVRGLWYDREDIIHVTKEENPEYFL